MIVSTFKNAPLLIMNPNKTKREGMVVSVSDFLYGAPLFTPNFEYSLVNMSVGPVIVITKYVT